VSYWGIAQKVFAENLNEIKVHVENAGIHLTPTQATELANIQTIASSTTNGNIKINNVETPVYALPDNGVNDTKIGNRTADPTTATAYALTGSVTQFFSWIAKRFAEATGVAWGTAVPASLKTLWELTWTQNYLMVNPANGYVSPIIPLPRDGTGQYIKFYPQGAVSAATTVSVFQGSGLLTLAAAITSTTATTMTLSSAITFTGSPLALIDVNGVPEVVQMTGGSGTTTITIVRGQGGTTAATHATGMVVLPVLVGSVSISGLAPVSLSTSSITGSKRDLFAYNVNGSGFAACKLTAVQEWGNR
jgi:hypothetical protein